MAEMGWSVPLLSSTRWFAFYGLVHEPSLLVGIISRRLSTQWPIACDLEGFGWPSRRHYLLPFLASFVSLTSSIVRVTPTNSKSRALCFLNSLIGCFSSSLSLFGAFSPSLSLLFLFWFF